MSERLILAITGAPGTGKTSGANHLAETKGLEVFEGSAYIQKAAGAHGIRIDAREAYEDYFKYLQKEWGMGWLSRTLFGRHKGDVVFPGLRSKYDFKRIKQAGGTVVGLVCPPEICLERIDREDPKNPATIIEYGEHLRLNNSRDEYGSHTDMCVEHADFTIDTSGSIEASWTQLDTIVDNLKA